MIRPAAVADAGYVADIYRYYIEHTTITFEEQPVSTDDMASRMTYLLGAGHPWLVAESSEGIVGYAYAGAWKIRSAYRHTMESTVYLKDGMTGRGLGTALYTALFEMLTSRHVHAVVGGIALPNAASVALHEKMGFEKVAHFKETGFKFARWIDVGYWERLF